MPYRSGMRAHPLRATNLRTALALWLTLWGCAGAVVPTLDRGIPGPAAWASARGEPAIVELSAAELARRIQARELSSEEVVRAFIAQTVRYNETYNAVVLLDVEGALERARAADEATARGERWGPLHGVPVTLKDTYSTRGLRTTAGAPALAGYVPGEDAAAVALLRRAGAIILGKTNAAMLAMDMQTTNPLFGTTRNPWSLGRTVGGSSGGCAAAVATHMSPLSFGSDLGGSIRLPSVYTGVYGLRPSRGVVSFRGHIPSLPGEVDGIRTMAVLGPIAGSVEDLELALSVIAQPSPEDPTPAPLRPLARAPASAAELRVAYALELGGVPVSQEMSGAIRRAVDALEAAGAQVTRAQPEELSLEKTWETWGALVGSQGGYERSNFERWFGRLFAYASVREIPHLRRILDPISVEGYMRALTEQWTQTRALERFLADYDVWVVPLASTAAFPHHAPSDTFGVFNVYDTPLDVDGRAVHYYVATQAYASIFSVTEGPVLAFTTGLSSEGLPVGVQLVGRRYEDLRLLAVARILEPLLPKPRLRLE